MIFPRCHVSRSRSHRGPSHDVVRFCKMIVHIPTIPGIAARILSIGQQNYVVQRPAIPTSTGVRVFLHLHLSFFLSYNIKWYGTISCDVSDHKMMSASQQPMVIKSYDPVANAALMTVIMLHDPMTNSTMVCGVCVVYLYEANFSCVCFRGLI
jgi:hypothetical protein